MPTWLALPRCLGSNLKLTESTFLGLKLVSFPEMSTYLVCFPELSTFLGLKLVSFPELSGPRLWRQCELSGPVVQLKFCLSGSKLARPCFQSAILSVRAINCCINHPRTTNFSTKPALVQEVQLLSVRLFPNGWCQQLGFRVYEEFCKVAQSEPGWC